MQNPELGPYLQCGLLGGGRASLVRCEVGVARAALASLWAVQKSTLVGRFEAVEYAHVRNRFPVASPHGADQGLGVGGGWREVNR